MGLNLTDIDRVKTITKEDFIKNYFKPQKPVVIENFIEDWPAYTKWNLEYIKEVAGDKTVPLYDDRPVDYKDGFNEPHATMKMNEYVDLLKREPTKFRIFLWNVLKEVPVLQKDFSFPDFGLRLMKGLPMLFFGGTDSYTFMHYDIDLANIFHFHFEGKKEVILFDQKQNKYLYKIPHSLITREDINFANPDFDKWPEGEENYVRATLLYEPSDQLSIRAKLHHSTSDTMGSNTVSAQRIDCPTGTPQGFQIPFPCEKGTKNLYIGAAPPIPGFDGNTFRDFTDVLATFELNYEF